MIKSSRRRRRSGIFAPRVTVRPHRPAYIRWLIVLLACTLILALSWGMYDAGHQLVDSDEKETIEEMDHLSRSNARLSEENGELRMKIAALERQLQMDAVAREDIASHVKAMEDENTRLKEELAFFENLGTAIGKIDQQIFINQLKLVRGQLPGEYRYSMLLVQSGKRVKDFKGSLEFIVHFRQNGEKMVTPLASENPSNTFDVNFKFYQRIENGFRMPLDAQVESMQVKVFEKGVAQARLSQSVNLSL
ncbi:DUF6776 family protein [Nitrosovibrio sp. Nv17]|jgi:hypothetical protein|uniref:DUF6776 family protein n=1 Tax=Nitrosovibrio sp. Nv17 TaxID=1855339 RepID=UPI000908D305|nr:DUF6776 family protein [Nitrosovibrio sp. Nv17]SFW11070.1 hypothetical protein SAMN05216414_101191 [Nitrosovibrio sp. Nv17]